VITEAAKVNLAAVNYHFGDKETLFREVILRRIQPLNALRLAMLDEACVSAGSAPPPLEQIIRILAEPIFDLHRKPHTGGRAFVQLLSRGPTEPLSIINKILADEYHPLLNRFGQVIRRHAPQLSPEEFLWRLSFIIGAMHHTLATLHQMNVLTRGICRSDDYDGALARFIAHAGITFKAPPASAPIPSR
jgi:AcrR family transcriptional regulator